MKAKLQMKMHFKRITCVHQEILTICCTWNAFLVAPKTPIQQPLRNITRQHEKQIKSEPLARKPTNEQTSGKGTHRE